MGPANDNELYLDFLASTKKEKKRKEKKEGGAKLRPLQLHVIPTVQIPVCTYILQILTSVLVKYGAWNLQIVDAFAANPHWSNSRTRRRSRSLSPAITHDFVISPSA